MTARRISFVNFKGGVGKTSLVVNLAASLAHEFGQRVLVVDCDGQSNSSIWLLGAQRWSYLNETPEKTVYAIFMDQNFTPQLHLNVIKSVIHDDHNLNLIPTLDLLPATYHLMDLEHEYRNNSQLPYYLQFNQQLSQFFDRYDYIIFDCPPNVFRASQCAIFSSSEIYIPCNPDILSYVGLSLLGHKIEQFQKVSRPFRSLALDYRQALIRGIILNGVVGQANYDTLLSTMRARIQEMQGRNAVAEDADVLPRRIRHSVQAGKSVTLHLPVILTHPNHALTEDYIKLAEYIHQKTI